MKHVFWLGFLLGSAALAQNPSELPETYVVQPGDTCMDIAKKFFGSASEYPRLHEHNDMGPLPHNLQPGSIVRLRAATDEDKATVKSDAVLTAFSATVNTRGANMSEWKLAERNQLLFRLDEVHTLSNASADILFRDHSTLQMKQNALIIIYGGSSSKVRSRKAGGVKLLQGELGVSLADLRKPPATISTPSAEVSARAKEAIIDVDASQTSRISIQSGEAEITAQGKSVRVKSGQGTRVKKDASPEPPSPLPSPPGWENAKTRELYVTHGPHKVASLLQWGISPSPGHYRVEVAKDSLFQHPTFEKTTTEAQFSLSELPPGTSYVRIRAIDEAGLIGSPSPSKRLDILKVDAPKAADTPDTPDASDASGQTPKIAGQVPFNLNLDLPEDIQVFVDGQRVSLPLLVEQPGKYLLEFKTMDGESTQTELEVSPAPFTLEMGLNQDGKPELQLYFEAAVPPNAKLKAQGVDGTLVGPLFRQEDGQTFKALLAGHRPYHVRLLWGDYPLGSLQKDVEPLPPPPLPVEVEPNFPDDAQPLAILRERQLGSLALPSAFLPGGYQLNLALDVDFPKENATMARLAARFDGPFKQGSYFANLTLVNYIGKNETLVYPELSVGTQMQFPVAKRWTAGFAADLAGNLNIHRISREPLLRLRAMGTFGYQSETFWASTAQGIATEYANSLRAGWIGSISVSWRIWPKFLLAAQLDGQKTASKGFASAAAVGFRLMAGPVEVGLTGHAGLTSEGRSQWGDYGASLTFGIR